MTGQTVYCENLYYNIMRPPAGYMLLFFKNIHLEGHINSAEIRLLFNYSSSTCHFRDEFPELNFK